MINKLYIKKCVMKNPRTYFKIVIIIIISIIIINMLSIFIDSFYYGDELRRLEYTKGSEIWIMNATQNDFMYFKDLRVAGTKYEAEDRTIYIKLYNERDLDEIVREINGTIMRNSLNVNYTTRYSNMVNNSSVPAEYVILFNVIKLIFTALGAVSIYFVYTMFIANKRKDIGILMALGIRKKQLLKLLFTELLIVYVFSFIIAMIVSNVVMYIVLQNFFIKHDSFIYVVYKFSALSSIVALILSLLSLVSAFTISAIKIFDTSIIATVSSPEKFNFNRNVNIWRESSAVKYITKANLFRNKKHFIISSLLSIPTICICIVFFNYTNILTLPVSESDFTIGVSQEIYNKSEIVLDNIEKLKSVDDIKGIDYMIYFNNFWVKLDSTKIKFSLASPADGVGYARASINVLSNSDLEKYRKNSNGDIDNYQLESYILISKNIPKLKYFEGDSIKLGEYLTHMHIENSSNALQKDENMKKMTIAGFINSIQRGDFLNIYVTEENFERITGHPPIPNIIYVNIKDDADIEAIKNELYNIFGESELFQIIDNIDRQRAADRLNKGIIILMAFLCSVMFVCIIILLWAFISQYIYNQKLQIYILNKLGATKRIIMKISVYEAGIKGIINSTAGFILGTWLSIILIKTSSPYSMVLNIYVFIVYALIFILTISTHIIPALITVKSLIAEEEK